MIPFVSLTTLHDKIPTLSTTQISVGAMVLLALLPIQSSLASDAPGSEGYISAEEISRQALHYAQSTAEEISENTANSRYKSLPLDSRLRLTRCQKALDFSLPRHNARASRQLVKVRCNDRKGWAIFVPLSVEHWQTVVVARHSLARNQRLGRDDVELKSVDTRTLGNHYLTQIAQVEGKLLRRALRAGSALDEQLLTKEKWIKRGDEVMIIARSAGISAKMAGVALADGGENEQILVKNQHSKRRLKATVIAPGKVAVIL